MADERESPSDETLVAYVRGKLPETEAARVAAEAARRPDLAAQIALIRGITAAAAAEVTGPAPGELGWARLSRAIDAEAVRPGFRLGRRLWPLAATAAAAILVWQVVAVPLVFGPAEQPGYVPVSAPPAGGPTLSVAFLPDATEAEMRTLLQEIGARIEEGPSAIGLWQLSFTDTAARDAGLLRLRGAAIVESAQAN